MKKYKNEGMEEYMNEFIERGKAFATKAHEGQKRKTSGAPYIGHPIHVAKILEDAGMPPAVIVAGFNHDTIEDTTITIEDIQKEFGDEVADLVAYNTEEKADSWEERKQHTIQQLKTGTLHQKYFVVADKYANLLELIHNHKTLGDEIWNCFKRGKEKQYWYFSNVLKSGKENLSAQEIPSFFNDYEEALESFFNTPLPIYDAPTVYEKMVKDIGGTKIEIKKVSCLQFNPLEFPER